MSMLIRRSICTAALMLPISAWAQQMEHAPVESNLPSPATYQVIYKGLVGNILESLPMDPESRVGLQRTNAVIGNSFLGRSLSVWLGLSGPVMLVGGLLWGIWSASNINPVPVAVVYPGHGPADSAGKAATVDGVGSSAVASAMPPEGRNIELSADFAVASAMPPEGRNIELSADLAEERLAVAVAMVSLEETRPQVLRLWLPQRSDARNGGSNIK